MKHKDLSLTSQIESDQHAQTEEMIKRLSEQFLSMDRPYRHDTQTDYPWGYIIYAISSI